MHEDLSLYVICKLSKKRCILNFLKKFSKTLNKIKYAFYNFELYLPYSKTLSQNCYFLDFFVA